MYTSGIHSVFKRQTTNCSTESSTDKKISIIISMKYFYLTGTVGSHRFRRDARLPVSRGAAEGGLRETCRHLGMW